ncbi:MAG: radical SAM protein [Candidatus Krumholzibacteriia bacterium]
MRGVLVFAPHASPTYVPLGLATLAAHVQVQAADCELVPIDLNLALWERQAEADAELAACRSFLRGRAGDFHDPLQYAAHQAVWRGAAASRRRLTATSRRYLETDEMEPELRAALAYAAGLIIRERPEWIGFSVMFPEQVLVSLALAKFLAEEVYAGAPPGLVLGGATASALRAEEVLRACPFLDAVFGGEGEQGLLRLLRGNAPASVPGLVFRRDDVVVTNRKPDTLTAAAVCLPSFTELDPIRYDNPVPVLPVVFSRGCKWRRCRFCAHNLSYSGYRRHAAERFADYLGELQARWGATHFYFADQYVAAEDMAELSRAILERGLRLSFHVMGRPTAAYTPDRLELMARAGCRWISWGVESGSARLLEVCGKGTTPVEIQQVVTDSARVGIFNLLMMIFGLPTSGPDDLQATMDLVADLGGAAGSVTSSRFQLFARTPFAARPDRYGLRVTGQEVLFSRGGQDVRSLRLFHEERAMDGSWRPPRGSVEVAEWERFRRWCRPVSELDGLCSEHLLLRLARGPGGSACAA